MELKEIIAKIETLKLELDSLGPLPDDAMGRLEQKIRMDWNYHSNVIEGNQLDYGETRSLLLWGITAKGKPLKDHLDLEGHNEALKKLELIAAKEIPLTETLIRDFHKLILAEPFDEFRKDVKVGRYKETDNYLYNERGERIEFCPPVEVPGRLNELLNWTNNAISPPKRKKKQYDIHPLLTAARFHLEFINIHPFDDGNGRLARIFMNLILMQCGYPPVVIRKESRSQYFSAIEESRERGIEVLADFIGEQLIKSLELYMKAAKGESIEEPNDLDKQLALLKVKLEKSKSAVQKTRESISDVYLNSIQSLFENAQKQLHKFDEFFSSSGISYRVNNTSSGDKVSSDLTFIDKRVLYPYKNLSLSDLDEGIRIEDTAENINTLSLVFEWFGFKRAGILNFDFKILLEVNLENLKYSIKSEPEVFPEKILLYDEYLTSDDVNGLVNKITGGFLKHIESTVEANIRDKG